MKHQRNTDTVVLLTDAEEQEGSVGVEAGPGGAGDPGGILFRLKCRHESFVINQSRVRMLLFFLLATVVVLLVALATLANRATDGTENINKDGRALCPSAGTRKAGLSGSYVLEHLGPRYDEYLRSVGIPEAFFKIIKNSLDVIEIREGASEGEESQTEWSIKRTTDYGGEYELVFQLDRPFNLTFEVDSSYTTHLCSRPNHSQIACSTVEKTRRLYIDTTFTFTSTGMVETKTNLNAGGDGDGDGDGPTANPITATKFYSRLDVAGPDGWLQPNPVDEETKARLDELEEAFE